MDRRRFLKDAGQLGAGLGVAESLRGASPQAGEGKHTPGKPLAGGQVHTPVVSLNGEWLIVIDPDNSGREKKWFDRPAPGAKPQRVPGILQEAFPKYHGVVWYWREFTPLENPYAHGRYLLHFGAVDYLAEVWVNGAHVGRHEGGDTPFTLDITASVRPGVTNQLAVRVLNPGKTPIDGIALDETGHRNKVVDYSPGSSMDSGGIDEPVELILTPAARVDDLHLVPDWKTGRIRVQARVRNDLVKSAAGRLQFAVAPAPTGQTLSLTVLNQNLAPGDSVVEAELQVEDHKLWDLKNPFLYRVTARLESSDFEGLHESTDRCGFRDFRVTNGYFRLNGNRIFLRSTHTGNHCPWSQVWPPPGYSDLLRQDLYHAKSVGFNAIRFISGLGLPYQLDLCDELGLLVLEESFAAWLLHDSPKMKERFEQSVRGMVLRDRNHPSLAIWGMLNETTDGPVFREAVSALKLVRSLDSSRLVLLSSGRWDGHLEIGSVSNPGSSEWECVWGKESPGAGASPTARLDGMPNSHDVAAYDDSMGDVHFYPDDPQTDQVNGLLRTMGSDSKPVYLSEAGIGSMMDVIHEARNYEQARIPEEAEDYQLVKSMSDRLIADWERWGFGEVYPFAESLLRASQIAMARHRIMEFNLIRSNPKICGYNVTGMLDHGFTGEGVWRFWRDFKPQVMDAMQDGWWPVRWCLFVNPTHAYLGQPVKLEAVIANEDVLQPGDYPVRFRVFGPKGPVWDRQATLSVPKVAEGGDGPLAIPVLSEEVVLSGPPGSYQFVPYIERGVAPPEASWGFYLTDPGSVPRLDEPVSLWGVPPDAEAWLRRRGCSTSAFPGTPLNQREVILVGELAKSNASGADWKELASRMARGSTVVFLSPRAFARDKDSTAWLPLTKKGTAYEFGDGLYHKEGVAKLHPIFEGLQGHGMLDWYYYTQMHPRWIFEGQEMPDEVVAAGFATGYTTPGGYASGFLVAKYKFGAGRFVINTFPILDHLGHHPAADRMLTNMVQYARAGASGPSAELPSNFDEQLKAIGYIQ